MRNFKVQVSREWTEYGEVTVEADDEVDAKELVMEILSNDDDSVEWLENMDPGKDDVESIEEV